MIDVVQLVKDQKAIFQWHEVISEYNGYKLYIKILRDAMKFDNIPELTWDFHKISDKVFNGVRLPASAHQLQEIAYLLDASLLTTKIIDLIWIQAKLKFDSITTVHGKIVAITNITDIHQEIEKKINSLGGDDGTKLIECVGKYWCITNKLICMPPHYGDECACNYGWFAEKASGPGLTPGTQCWQRPGFQHGKSHWDPSQTIRLMSNSARLIGPDGKEHDVHIRDILTNPQLAPLASHEGSITYLEQKGVPKLEPINKEITRDKFIQVINEHT